MSLTLDGSQGISIWNDASLKKKAWTGDGGKKGSAEIRFTCVGSKRGDGLPQGLDWRYLVSPYKKGSQNAPGWSCGVLHLYFLY